MAELKLGESLAELKKTVEKNRKMWKQVVASKEKEWQKKIKEIDDKIAENKAAATQKESELLTETHKLDAIISSLEYEKSNLNEKKEKLKEKLLSEQTEKKKQQEKLHEATTITMKSEVKRRQEDVNKKFRDKEMKCELQKLHIKELEEQISALSTRLLEDQKRWQDVLRMKAEDFTTLKNELVNRVKETQSEYKEEEKEALILKNARLELENKVKEKEKRLREEEAKWREQITSMENEINKLQRELEWKDKTHRADIISKEKELEALKKEMDRFVDELTGGVKIAKTESAEEEKSKPEFRQSQPESQIELREEAEELPLEIQKTEEVAAEVEEEKIEELEKVEPEQPKKFWKKFLRR